MAEILDLKYPDNKKLYMTQYQCFNCGFPNKIEVPKGMKVLDWIKGDEEPVCKNCDIELSYRPFTN